MYLIRLASARIAAAKNNGTSDLWRSHSGAVASRLFLLYATPVPGPAAAPLVDHKSTRNDNASYL